MVISGLAAAIALGGAGVADDTGRAHVFHGETASRTALAAATPLPAELLHVLDSKQVDNVMRLPLVQDVQGAAPAQPGEQPPADTAPPPADAATPPADATEPDVPPAGDAAAGGEIIVSGEVGAPEGDPAERVNALSYEVVDAVDTAVVKPVADAYSSAIPEPIRDGVDNFLTNLGEPVSALHYLLQLKPGRALETLGRFAINTTLGIAGIFDVAAKEPFYLEHQRNGLANTLGYYGVGPGPYLYLPLIGSTTVRDLFGRIADLSVVPTAVGQPLNNPYYATAAGTLNSLNDRVDKDAQIASVREKCGDPYAAERDLYLIQREAEIEALKGNANPDLGEIGERLEFNCDIAISETPTGMGQPTDFVRESTTLIDGSQGAQGLSTEEAVPPAEAAPEAAPPEESVQPAQPQPAAPQPAETPFVSEPVVQPVDGTAANRPVVMPEANEPERVAA